MPVSVCRTLRYVMCFYGCRDVCTAHNGQAAQAYHHYHRHHHHRVACPLIDVAVSTSDLQAEGLLIKKHQLRCPR